MITEEKYYTAPEKAIFEDVKENAIKIWKTYDDSYGYASQKIGRIKDIENVRDNTAYMIQMFDYSNQAKLLKMVKPKTKKWIERLLKS